MESSSLSSVASWESRAIVVFPLPEGPQKRYAWPFRIRLAAWMTRPWASTSAREYTIRKKVSTENSLGRARITVPRRCSRSTVPARSPRATRKRASPPSRVTTTSSRDDRPGAASAFISIRQPGAPVERKPLYRSRTTSAISGFRVRIPVRRPAISMLSSPTQCGSHDAPHRDGEGKEEWNEGGDGGDRPVAPPGDTGIETFNATTPLDRDGFAQDLPPVDGVGRGQGIALGNETLPPALDHAVEEEPTRRCLVTDHVANTDLRSGGWHDEHDITVPEEGHHARAPGLDSQGPAPSQQIGGQVVA